MKKCLTCDATYEDSKKFCGKCGKPLVSTADQSFLNAATDNTSALTRSQGAKKVPGLKLAAIILFSVLLLIAIVFCFFSFHPSEPTIKDIDGNVYQTVKIGNQLWTVENLRTTKYNDGSPIAFVPGKSDWANTKRTEQGAYCFFNNTQNADSMQKFGALYNWYAVNTNKLAPEGWHVPTNAEWDALEKYLIDNGHNWDNTGNDNKIAKSLSAKTDWATCSSPGAIGNDLSKNNRSGFSALPAGNRTTAGFYGNFGNAANWWTSTRDEQYNDNLHACYRMLYYNFPYSGFGNNNVISDWMWLGCSIRLIKN